jgi:hypothetical protein
MYRLLLLIITGLLAACSTTTPHLPLSDTLRPGAVVETLSSTVTVALRTADRNLAARGVMLYRRPDQLRLVLLSPFGTTLMEAQVKGERLTLAYPANGVAYQGLISELPAATGQRGFAMLRWVLDTDLPAGSVATGSFSRPAIRGGIEQVSLQDGLIVEKNLSSGERVRYRNYRSYDGVPLAQELQMESAEGDRIRLTLEEPEVNLSLEEQAFDVPLTGLRLLPLSQLKTP